MTINNLVANYAGQVVALRNLDEIEHTLRWLADLLAAACCATNIVPGLCVIFAGRR